MLAVPQSTALVLFTLSPVPHTCRFAPVFEEPCPPVMRKPLRLDALLVVRELALRAVLVVMVACFPFSAVMTLVPDTTRVPLSVAAPSQCKSRVATTSRPWISAVHVTLATESCELELIEVPAFA